jgi:hypothetical protein
MAVKKRPDADRLPVSQRIDSRVENPKRRQMRPTDWAIKGELFLNCNCTVFCPCVVSLGKHPPTEGNCKAWMAIAIDEGHYEGESLTGLNVGLMVEIPGRMAEGDWKVAAYIDERASGKAYNGLAADPLRCRRGDHGPFHAARLRNHRGGAREGRDRARGAQTRPLYRAQDPGRDRDDRGRLA